MTRAAIAAAFLALIVVIAGGAYIMGKRADTVDDLKAVIDTKQGIKDAQENAGDIANDWWSSLLRHTGKP